MKLPFICLLFLISIVQIECRPDSWYNNVWDKVSNKTAAFAKYLEKKGREINELYVNKIRNNIRYLFGIQINDVEPEIIKASDSELTTSTTVTSEPIPTPIFKVFTQLPVFSESTSLKVKLKEYATKLRFKNEETSNDTDSNKNEPKMTFICSEQDPSIYMTTPQLIALHGYRSESHTIVTDDGYILTIHRIPYSKDKRVSPRNTVLLHHGLLGSSADWVISGPEKGLAYILSEAGYDVWLANVRGNTYSRAHVSRNINTFEFWNFTFHEVSQHDLPAVIDYIGEIKGTDTKIDYVGHSMGTTILFALLSTKSEYNKILRAGYALAPVAYMTNIRSPIRLLARFSDNLEYLMKLLGANEFLPQNTVLKWLSEHACEINHYEEAICENSMFVLCGHDESQFNKTLLPIILAHTPAGASTKTLIHYAQEIKNSGRFQQFDYGPEDNKKYYGQPTPPVYELDKITLPIALLSAENDWLASDIDVTKLYVQLKNPIEHYIVPLKEFNHIDFLYAIDAPKLVYAKLLQLLNEMASNNIPFDEDVIETNVVTMY